MARTLLNPSVPALSETTAGARGADIARRAFVPVADAAAPTGAAGTSARVAAWAPVVLAVAVALAYANGLGGGFHFDDTHVVQDNLAIRSLANVPRFYVDPTTSSASPPNRVLRPLLMTTFALNYSLSGLDARSYHVVNVVLHWLVAWLVFGIVRRHLWLGDAGAPIGLVAALVVALHPLNTSAVDYVSARSALLNAACYLGAFDAALRGRRPLAVVLLVGAMLTKEIAVTLPLALLGWRLVSPDADAKSRVPGWFVATLAGVAIAGLAYRAWIMPPALIAAVHDPRQTRLAYFMTEWSALLYYLRLFVWPNALVVDRADYPMVETFRQPQAWASLAALLGLGTLAWRARRRCPALTFAAVWYVVSLAAESTIFPLAEPVNEHRPYLAMLGLGTATALALWWAATTVARLVPVRALQALAVLTVVLCAGLAAATVARNAVWRDDYALWKDATEKAPTNARAWTNAGLAALNAGRLDEARTLLTTAHALSPCYAYALLNLSALDRRAGNPADALRWATEAVGCRPELALTHYYRAAALETNERMDDALAEYRTATRLDPGHPGAWHDEAKLLERREEWADAADAYERAFDLDPRRDDAGVEAGVIRHRRLGDPARAVALYRRVLAIMPTHYGARYQLSVALLAAGDRAAAVDAWRTFRAMAERIDDRAALDAAPEELRNAS